MNSLVAGGAGFIGSYLCQYLIDKGENVFVVDNFLTGKCSNLNGIAVSEVIEKDICELENFDHPIDTIYNLACPASPQDFERLALEIHRCNSQGHENLLKLAVKKQAKILFTSSSEVYGNAEVHPQSEDYKGAVNCLGIRSCYDEGKRFSESLTMTYHRKFQLDTRIARIFNTYGPRMRTDDGRIISNFINQAIKGLPLTVYGDGLQTRCFTFVEEMCEGLYNLMHSNENGPVNLGRRDEISIIQVAEIVNALTSNTAGVKYLPLPEDDPRLRKPALEKAEQLLNWNPQMTLEEGLKQTISYYSQLAEGQ